jgi:DNA-binding Lrp family transcriptional regulator
VQISAHSILHTFSPRAWSGITNELSGAQLAKLRAAQQPVPAAVAREPAGLLPEDEPLLAEMARDARTSVAALAAAIHWHESTVRRRIEELRQAGLLCFEVDIDSAALGFSVGAMLWLSVEPTRLDAAGRALAAHPEIPVAAATTGQANLIGTAILRDTEHLYEYLTGPLARLPGVSAVETAPVISTLKRTGLLTP